MRRLNVGDEASVEGVDGKGGGVAERDVALGPVCEVKQKSATGSQKRRAKLQTGRETNV
jgi:hypothetical protein